MTSERDSEPSKAWDHHALTYARTSAPCTAFLAQTLFQHVAGRLPKAPRILEIACGHGELARQAVLHCLADGGGSVLATDFSEEMVQRTARTHPRLR